MLKKLIILMSVSCFTQVFAADVLLKIGANNSWLSKESDTSEYNVAYGIGVQFPLDESQRIKVGVDVLYVAEQMFLQDRSRPYDELLNNDCKVYSSDLHLHYHYIGVPVYLNSIIFRRQNTTAMLKCGTSLKYVIGNDSSAKNYNFNIETCNYDYERVWTDSYPLHPIEVMAGGGFSYKNIGIELLYHYTIGKTKSLYGIKIQDHVHSIRLMCIWQLF